MRPMADSTFMDVVIFTCYLLMFIKAAPMCNFDKLKHDEIGLCGPNGTTWHCPSCQPGYGQLVECGRKYPEGTKVGCVPCKENHTYSDTYDISQCKQCTRCQENEVQIGQCTREKDTKRCTCKPGYYRDTHTRDCKPCSWCCQDKSNDNVEECKHLEKKCSLYTAKSCDPTTTSAPTTTADPTTLAPKTTVHTVKQARTEESQNKSNPTTFNPNDSEFKSTTKGSEKPKDILLAILVPVSIVFLALLIVYCYKKRRGNSSIFSELKSIKVPLLRLARQLSNDEEKKNSIISLNLKTDTAKYVKEGETEQAERSNNPSQASQSTNCEDESEKLEKRRLIHMKYGPRVENMPHDVKNEVCLMLNPIQRLKANDYRKVADEIGLTHYQIRNLAKENPMEDVFEVMISQTKKVDEFVDILFKIHRVDVVLKMYEMALSLK